MGEWAKQQATTVSEDINSAGKSRLRTCGRPEPSSQTSHKALGAEKNQVRNAGHNGHHPGAERAESVGSCGAAFCWSLPRQEVRPYT